MSELEDYLQNEGEMLDAERPGFIVDDDSKADWALKKIALAEESKRRRSTFVTGEIERLRHHQAKGDAQDDQSITYFTGLLSAYFEALRAQGLLGKAKSYRLPHGLLSARQQGPRWQVYDKVKLLEWAESVQLVREEREPAWDEIKARLAPLPASNYAIDTVTGQVVPGVRLEQPKHDEFMVRPDVDIPF